MTDTTSAQILALPMRQPNDADAATVREYLIKLLATLWDEGVDFDSKRPFESGNSGWAFELYSTLVASGVVDGGFDEDGGLNEFSAEARTEADRLITDAIQALGAVSAPAGADWSMLIPSPSKGTTGTPSGGFTALDGPVTVGADTFTLESAADFALGDIIQVDENGYGADPAAAECRTILGLDGTSGTVDKPWAFDHQDAAPVHVVGPPFTHII